MDFKSESAVVKRQRCLSTREWLTKAGLKKLLPHFAKESITVDHCVWLHDAKQLDAWFIELKLGVMDRVRLQRAISEVVKARADADALKSTPEESRHNEPAIVKPTPYKPPPAFAQSVAIGLDTAVSPDVATNSCMLKCTEPLLAETSVEGQKEAGTFKLLAAPISATEVDAYYWQQQVAAGPKVAKPESASNSESDSDSSDSCDSNDTLASASQCSSKPSSNGEGMEETEGSGLHPGVTGAEETEVVRVRKLGRQKSDDSKHTTERKSDEIPVKSMATESMSKSKKQSNYTLWRKKYQRRHAQRGLSTNLFIRGLPTEWSKDEVRRFFEKFGRISLVEVWSEKMVGGNVGKGCVSFVHPRDALDCVEQLHGTYMDSTLGLEMEYTPWRGLLLIKFTDLNWQTHKRRSQQRNAMDTQRVIDQREMCLSTTNLYVAGFSSECTSANLYGYFERFGAIASVFRYAKTVAFVKFRRAEDAAYCIAKRKDIPMLVKFADASAEHPKHWRLVPAPPRHKSVCKLKAATDHLRAAVSATPKWRKKAVTNERVSAVAIVPVSPSRKVRFVVSKMPIAITKYSAGINFPLAFNADTSKICRFSLKHGAFVEVTFYKPMRRLTHVEYINGFGETGVKVIRLREASASSGEVTLVLAKRDKRFWSAKEEVEDVSVQRLALNCYQLTKIKKLKVDFVANHGADEGQCSLVYFAFHGELYCRQ